MSASFDMITLDEIEPIENSTLTEAENRARRWVALAEAQRQLTAVQRDNYLSLIRSFAGLGALYLQLQAQILRARSGDTEMERVPAERAAAAVLLNVANAIEPQLSSLRSYLGGENGEAVGEISALARRMIVAADAFIAACDLAIESGGWDFLRPHRDNDPVEGHALKGRRRRPRPKPGR